VSGVLLWAPYSVRRDVNSPFEKAKGSYNAEVKGTFRGLCNCYMQALQEFLLSDKDNVLILAYFYLQFKGTAAHHYSG